MLEQPVINLITTPLVAGVVGYVTNKIAIKMLFRPYKPKWYTLGWQGIVPKTRPKLANKISEIVGQKLLAHDDFLYALEHNDIKASINNIINTKLSTLSQKDIHVLIRLFNIEDRLIAHKEAVNNILNNAAYFFIQQLLEKKINVSYVSQPILNVIKNINIEQLVLDEIEVYITKIYDENKQLKELLPEYILEKKEYLIGVLTNIIMDNIQSLGRNPTVQKVLIEKIIQFKNKMFASASGVDVLKAGFISLFLSDEKIMKMVQDELPNITYDLSKNKDLYISLYNMIEKEIDKFLNKNFQEILFILGFDNKSNLTDTVNNIIISKDINNKVLNIILDKLYKYNNLTVNEVFKILQIDINSYINIDIMNILTSNNYKANKNNLIMKLTNYISSNSYKISSIITEFTIKLIKGNLKYALNAINIEKIVKDKINALPLPEVENILFSFMKEHFKWINILGFFIGFLIGLIQAVSVYFVR